MGQFHFDPDTYRALMAEEVPLYERLQDEVARATAGIEVARMLELGTGTGETAERVLAIHARAELVGIDAGESMLAHARARLSGADLRLARLEDALPGGSFDLVFSALTVHHLDGLAKADLFVRVAEVLRPGGRFVLGDVVIPDDPADVVTPIDGDFDKPSTVGDQCRWLTEARFQARVAWSHRDLAVIVGEPAADR